MGKMTGLQYLNVSDNPFRQPLSTLLDCLSLKNNEELGGADAAKLVVNFMDKLSQAAFSNSPAILRSSSGHRGVPFYDENNYRSYQAALALQSTNWWSHKKTAPFTTFEKTILGIFLVMVIVVAFPILTAMFYDTSYLDQLVKGQGDTWEQIWTSYKPYHMSAERAIPGVLRDGIFQKAVPEAKVVQSSPQSYVARILNFLTGGFL